MADRGTVGLGSGDSRDGGRAAMPLGVDAHRGAPAPPDGDEAHRGKLGHARRHKRPVCETELPSRKPSSDAQEPASGDTVAATEADVPHRRSGLGRDQFETLIIREWTKTLKGPYDWADWPLARYSFAPGFLDAVAQQRGVSAMTLARACAMVACGRAERMRSVDPRPQLDADGSPIGRADGATAWHCNLRRDALSGPQLCYWMLPGGRIEFEAVVASDKDAQPAKGDESSPPRQDRQWGG